MLFLPISNFQQRMTYYSAFWWGFDLIVTDPNHLFRALKELRPTLLIAPPALYEAFESRFDNLPPGKRWMAQIVADIALAIPIRSMREELPGSSSEAFMTPWEDACAFWLPAWHPSSIPP